jgi:mono/diheme cytochrome c family protein
MNRESTVLELLSASLLRPLVLVAVAGLVLRVFRVEHPASKHAVWAAVLVGILILPFLSVALPHIEIQALPQRALVRFDPLESEPRLLPVRETSAASQYPGQNAKDSMSTVASDALPVAARAESIQAVPRQLSSRSIVLWGYLAGLVVFGAYRLTGSVLLRRLVARSKPTRYGPMRESADVAVPIAVGILRPRVILPSEWRQWSAASRRAVLAHEFAHVRRKDAWVLALSRLAKFLLWFHPLSWWVSRRIAELAEMACDAAAVERIADPERYSRILVDFAGMVNRRGYRATLPGLAIFSRSKLSHRIDEILAVSNGKRRRLARPAVVIALIGVPCLAAAAALGLTEAAARPLQQVQQKVAERIESVAQVAGTEGVVAAIAEVIPPVTAVVEPPVQSAATTKEFVDRYCISCHSKATRVANFVLEGEDPTNVRNNARVWEKAALRLKSALEPRRGQVPNPTPAEVQNVVTFLEAELDRNAPPFTPAPGPHRLNRSEYRNAIQDVLGLDVNPGLLLPGDDSQYGFDNIASALGLLTQSAPAYIAAADRLTAMALEDPVSRQKILVCRPTAQAEEELCARQIITSFATRAFRQELTAADMDSLINTYRKGSPPQFFNFYHDGAIRNLVRTVLADSRFWSRTEGEPTNVTSGQSYRITDIELASRLSYFLWSRGPDNQLLDIATRGQLSNPVVLEAETRRMLKDPRSEALTLNFAAQWLNIRGLRAVGPMPQYPDFDEPLREAMQREAELFFQSIVDEDRNVLDLLTADYTFLNERLARHYGITTIFGNGFQRVTLPPSLDMRRGLLGKAAILTVTSHPDRTSLSTRGKWLMGTLLGVYPPDPPPNVPGLGPKRAPMREMMQQHLINPACVNCHRIMDPIGITLDNFDQAGKWRTQDGGQTIDASTELFDGTRLNGPADLRNALVTRSDLFVRTMTQKLLAYSLGRTPQYPDLPLVRSITRDAARDGNRFSAIVVGIVKSPVFQMNTKN